MFRYAKKLIKKILLRLKRASNLLWPSEEEDKVTRKFYRDLSNLQKIESKIIKTNYSYILWRREL